MSSITEQFSAATKSQLEAQFHLLNTLATTAVDSAEKVIALNLTTTKASVEKSSAAAKQLWSAKDPKEFFSVAQPGSFDALLAYGRELYSIASTAQQALVSSAQGTFKQASEAAKANAGTALTAAAPAVAVPESASVAEAVAAAAIAPKLPKPKPVAAPIPEQQDVIEVKAAIKPSFPETPPQPIALAPEAKPAKAAPKAKK